MAGSIRGGKVKSIGSLKASLRKGGGNQYFTRVSEDGLTVRFLTEPDEWVEFFEHYDDVRKFYPCTDDCEGCRDGSKPSKRYLTNAVDTTEGKVVPLLLAKSAASQVIKKFDRFNTILDRDYIIVREGTGFDTEYDVTPEAPSKMNLSRFELLDLWELLESQITGDDTDVADDEEAEEEEEEVDPTRRPRRILKKKVVRKKIARR